ncbi:hypothetical protein Glove_307g60 [Diversispora epigaea]|uniref:CCHC-type domain-containing protein n=2 Tax=Diversispora epigaea TaxID=1348612 RepID=A0A397HY16_9GLOM|nr:hypothetical protein Glove_307g60 [Diversispora epigaea]
MDLAHIETLETNKVLRDELNSEVNINILNEKKIQKYLYELEQCNKTISFQDSTIIAQESKIQELKSRVLNLKKRLRIALEDVKKKESYILYLEQELINLEDEINRLKTRIHEICSHRNILKDNTNMTQRPPQPPAIEIRQNYEDIQKHLGDVRLYFQNRIQVPFSRDAILKKLGLISTSANRLQEIAQNNQPIDQRITQLQNQYDTSQGILNLTRTAFTNEQQERREKNSRQTIINLRQQIFVLQNNPLPNLNMAAIQDVMQTISPRLAILPDYDGQEPPHTYYAKLRAINETARPLGVAAFNDAERANVMKSKMTGRFFPVPAQNSYNANANIVTEVEVYNWMQGKYRETIIGNQRASLKALMSERFTSLDTIDTYEKRIRPYVLGIVDGEVLPYLYNHLPPRLETRIRIANPNTVNDFFTQLRIIWLEFGESTSNFGNEINTSASAMAYKKFVDIAIRLGYSGDLSDPIAIHQFVENDLTRNYGRQSNHIKKEPFGQNNNTKKVYATKKPQKPTKVTYKCSNCEKIGHRKNKCPKLGKKPKKVNYTYQSEPEISDQEDEVIEVLEDEDEENDEEDEETIPDTEPQNCFNLEQCNKTISFQDSTIIAQESEIQELKSRVLNLKKRLRIALEDVKKKESYILYLEQELINLEDEINRLKTRIHEICSHRNILKDNTNMTQRPPQPPAIEIRQNYEDIQKHLGDVRLYFQNRIQVPFSRDAILKKLGLISTSANRLQEIAQNNQPIDQRITQLQNQYDTSQGILNLTRTAFTNEQQERREKNSRQTIINLRQQIFVLQNNPLPNLNMAAIQDVMQTISPRLAILPDYDGQEPPHTYYAKLRAINETARPLGVAAFNDAERANVMKSKMTGRFFPVPAQNSYNANANIVTEVEVYNWMQGKYRETIIGNQRASLKALMSERFTSLDTIDTYEKRIRPYVLGIVDGEVLPYLYNHLPPRLETRIRIANPNTVNDFFTQLRIIWLEFGESTSNFGNEINTSASAMAYKKFVDIAIRLGYSGDLSDPIAIHQFVENDLTRNYGRQSNHIKKEPFGQNNNTKKVYATKKPQKPTKVTYKCSNCEKIGHRKNKR